MDREVTGNRSGRICPLNHVGRADQQRGGPRMSDACTMRGALLYLSMLTSPRMTSRGAKQTLTLSSLREPRDWVRVPAASPPSLPQSPWVVGTDTQTASHPPGCSRRSQPLSLPTHLQLTHFALLIHRFMNPHEYPRQNLRFSLSTHFGHRGLRQ